MGIFDRFRNKSRRAQDEEEGDDGDELWEDDWEGEPSDAVAVVREGHNVPTDEEMREVLEAEAPDCVDTPRTGLCQMRWWKEQNWVPGGLRQIATALRRTYAIDPDKTTWKLCKDDRGARVGIVFMRK